MSETTIRERGSSLTLTMTFTNPGERDDSKHSEQDSMKTNAPEGATDNLGRVSPFSPSSPATVTVSTTSHALRFLTGNEIVDVEADDALTLTDVYEVDR